MAGVSTKCVGNTPALLGDSGRGGFLRLRRKVKAGAEREKKNTETWEPGSTCHSGEASNLGERWANRFTATSKQWLFQAEHWYGHRQDGKIR